MKILKQLFLIWLKIWSNIRWKDTTDIEPAEKIRGATQEDTIKFIVNTAQRISNKFKYTTDGTDQLWDCVRPPQMCYQEYANGTLEDDCDGYHACLYHVLHENDFTCALVCAVHLGD